MHQYSMDLELMAFRIWRRLHFLMPNVCERREGNLVNKYLRYLPCCWFVLTYQDDGQNAPVLENLLRKNICKNDNFFSPTPIEKQLLLSTHDEGYYNNLINLSLSKLDTRQIGFPLSEALIMREHVIAQGTIQNTRYAQQYGVSMNIAGGTHHAFRDRPGAFCMLNDQAIAANYLIDNNLAKRVMIVDLDVHQGDGTTSIFEHQDTVFTISFHGQKN